MTVQHSDSPLEKRSICFNLGGKEQDRISVGETLCIQALPEFFVDRCQSRGINSLQFTVGIELTVYIVCSGPALIAQSRRLSLRILRHERSQPVGCQDIL